MNYSTENTADTSLVHKKRNRYRKAMQGNNVAQRLFDILTENGGIAPAWQVQTQMGHMQQLLAEGTGTSDNVAWPTTSANQHRWNHAA